MSCIVRIAVGLCDECVVCPSGRLLRMDSRTSAAGDPETASQISRSSQHKPYMVLVASYGSFYLRMGADCK